MRAAERDAIAAGRTTGAALMEAAGTAVVAAIGAHWPNLAARPGVAAVLCGPGNNGGDGFVIARLLAARGWRVDVALMGDPARLPPDAQANLARWQALGGLTAWPPAPGPADLVVDALFGTGLTRPVDLPPGWPPAGARVVAVDLPSGLCADSGRVLGGRAMRADLTVAFHRPRPGHLLDAGPDLCGRLVVADIGLQADLPGSAALVGPPPAAVLAKAAGHKFDHGHALVLAGGPGHGGAARLAARAALRVGAGLVTLACPPRALAESAARLDAVMLRPLADAAALAALLTDVRIRALCLGPGLGTGGRERDLVAAALAAGRPAVLDADALTLIAASPDLTRALHPGCVLTPHGGEFARLFPDLAGRMQGAVDRGPAFSRLDAARAAAARAGCAVLLKGPDTVIATPEGEAAIHSAAHGRAAPWLATAGAGDVLAGLIAGLLARGRAPFQAACAAAWLHVEAARRFGPGLIAEDLPEMLPTVLRDLMAAG